MNWNQKIELSVNTKAARTAPGRTINPSGRMMRAMERDAEARIARALDKMRRDMMRGVTAYNAHLMPARLGSREVLQPFTDSLTAVLRDIALAGSEFGQEQINRYIFGVRKQAGGIDINWELANTAAEDAARRWAVQLSGGVTRTTQRRVQKEIAQWTTNNESLFQLTQRLSQPNGPFSPKRARMIAVTETTRAYAEGNTAAWKESGVVEKREWNTNIDELVCPICGPLHNVTAELDKPFPGGLMNPPAHPNCRCWILPVIEGAEEFETGLEQFGLQPTATGHEDLWEPLPELVQEQIDDFVPLTPKEIKVSNDWYDNGPDSIWDGTDDGRKHSTKRVHLTKRKVVNGLEDAANVSNDTANEFIHQWAASSNDNDYGSLTIQKEAGLEFGQDMSDWQKKRYKQLLKNRDEDIARGVLKPNSKLSMVGENVLNGIDEVRDVDLALGNKSARQMNRNMVKATYENTQEALDDLRDAGVERVKLYRGVRIDEAIANDIQGGDFIEWDSNVLESWSLRPDIAKRFSYGYEQSGRIFEMEVPLEQIYSTSLSGQGCLNEWEFIVIKRNEDLFRIMDKATHDALDAFASS